MSGSGLHPVVVGMVVEVVLRVGVGMVVVGPVSRPVRRVRQAGNTQRVLRVPGICAHRPVIGRRRPKTGVAAEPVLGAAAAARRSRRGNRGRASEAGNAEAAAWRGRTPDAVRLRRGNTAAGAARLPVRSARAAASAATVANGGCSRGRGTGGCMKVM
jgi:hypothetical protein